MPYAEHVRVTFRGSMPGSEIWTTNLNLDITAGNGNSDAFLEDLAELAVTIWTTFHSASSAGFSTVVFFERVDTYFIGSNGRAIRQGTAAPASPVGGVGTITMPNQIAVVASLRTGQPGRARRGRMYLPMLAQDLNTDGRWPATNRDSALALTGAMLNAFSGTSIGSVTFIVCVASGVGVGANYPVTSVQMGRVFDTQRRRRNQLVEAPASVPVA